MFLKAFCCLTFEPVFPSGAGKGFKEKKQALNNPFSVDSSKGAVPVPLLGALTGDVLVGSALSFPREG